MREFNDTKSTSMVRAGVMSDIPAQVHAGYLQITEWSVRMLTPVQLQELIDREAAELAADLFEHVMKLKGGDDDGIYESE